jgi:hypothetical protein
MALEHTPRALLPSAGRTGSVPCEPTSRAVAFSSSTLKRALDAMSSWELQIFEQVYIRQLRKANFLGEDVGGSVADVIDNPDDDWDDFTLGAPHPVVIVYRRSIWTVYRRVGHSCAHTRGVL